MVSLFGGKKERATKKAVAVIDVGSGSVGAALAELDAQGPPAILASLRAPVALLPARDERIADRVLDTLEETLSKLQAAGARALGGRCVDHVAVFLPAPWSQLMLRNLRLARSAPFDVNASVVARMLADYIHREHPEQEKSGSETIERSALGIRLNGYAVPSIPKTASASSLELTVVSCVAPKTFTSAVRDVVRKVCGHELPITLHSTSIAAAYALSAMRPENPDYLLVNSEGEVTELVLAQEHTPAGCATATAACNTILRTVSVHADMARAEATSALKLAKPGAAKKAAAAEKTPMNDRLSGTLAAAQKECADGFKAAAEELIAQCGAPRNVYILGEGPEAPWYADSIAKAPYLKSLFPGGVSVELLGPENLAKHMKAARPSAAAPLDSFLALETLYLDARFDEDLSFNFKLT